LGDIHGDNTRLNFDNELVRAGSVLTWYASGGGFLFLNSTPPFVRGRNENRGISAPGDLIVL